jgi:hypothetical protein
VPTTRRVFEAPALLRTPEILPKVASIFTGIADLISYQLLEN